MIKPSAISYKPLFSGVLSSKQWTELNGINKELHQEYLLRREMLLKRLDVTIQSFHVRYFLFWFTLLLLNFTSLSYSGRINWRPRSKLCPICSVSIDQSSIRCPKSVSVMFYLPEPIYFTMTRRPLHQSENTQNRRWTTSWLGKYLTEVEGPTKQYLLHQKCLPGSKDQVKQAVDAPLPWLGHIAQSE